MTAADKAALMDILRRTPEFSAQEVVVAEEVIDCYLKDPAGSGYYTLVAAEDGGIITGYICYGPTPMTDGTWDMYWEAVAPEKQGRGIGRALMMEAEAEVKKANGRLALIETSSTPIYQKTIRFHIGNGYEIIARIPDFYSPGDDKVIMQKCLK